MSDRLLVICLIVGTLVAAALIGKATYDYERYRTLKDDGRTASATVRDLQPAHNQRGPEGRWLLRYSFQTPDNKTVDASVRISKQQAEQLRTGQQIDVVYAPHDPATTALDVGQAWAVVIYDERLLIPYLAVLMVLAWNVLERYRRRHS